MKETITTTTTTEEEVELHICDHCSLEIEGKHRTVAVSPRIVRTDHAKALADQRRHPTQLPIDPQVLIAQEAPDFVELDSKAEIDLCEDCIEDLFLSDL